MKAHGWLLLPASAVIADAVIVAEAIIRARGEAQVSLALTAHLTAALVGGLLLCLSLPRLGHEVSLRAFALGVSLAFFVPVFGGAAVLVALLAIAVGKPRAETIPIDYFELPDLLTRRPPTEIRPRLPPGRLVHVVRRGRTMNYRFEAVLATGAAPTPIAVSVLKAALSDTAEEVRLSAFGKLETTRRTIEQRIEQEREILARGLSSARTHSLHATIAQLYFEIAYLGLADGEVYRHTLRTAWTHAREACALVPDDALMLQLIGRIHGREAENHESSVEARGAFEAAAAAGMSSSQLASDRAEEAYGRRAFSEVSELLRAMKDLPHDHVLLARIQEFWR